MLYKAEVKVTLKKGVRDPQGAAVEGAVQTLGYTNVRDVRIGKVIELWVEAESEAQAHASLNDLGHKILSNPIMETFAVTLTEVK
ncbi:MAG TPA: phosphoribosylformylglycinamidine synthase subunit PurS [Symbiobacteriaceae bacterium]|jgi:phosphoribosylformylglycinamidine synthase|nr:phosphoribosylformylglycinamidine synthase subunit PurS [Symbiobacteriaceae bacterium]